jgi:Trk K+ transport system NAD-binding subunit
VFFRGGLLKMKHLIIGAGYFGYNLAVSLSQKGEEVIVLDKNIEKIVKLRDIVTKAIQVDAADRDMLQKLVPSDVDQAIVCIGRSIENNCNTAFTGNESKKNNCKVPQRYARKTFKDGGYYRDY